LRYIFCLDKFCDWHARMIAHHTKCYHFPLASFPFPPYNGRMHIPGKGNNPNKRFVPPPQSQQQPPGEVVQAYFSDDFLPSHDLVLAEGLYIGQQGSIVIPDEVRLKQQTLRVIRTGPGRMTEHGMMRPPPCKEGDYIFGMVQQGIQFMIEGRHLVILQSSQVLGVFPTPPPNVVESETASLAAALKAKEEREAQAANGEVQPPPAE
jgi:co-chaperonin GroES (HSP10)